MTAYTSEQYEGNYPEGIERHFWHIARNAIIARTVRRWGMGALPLLDIGCGRGIVVDYLRARGIDCIGCDLADAPVPESLRGAVITRTAFADLPADLRGRIRGALLCDVIEHLPEPEEFLRAACRAFPALQCVLVTVPARRELWSQWDRRYGHFRRYGLRTLRATLAAAGFERISVGYFFHGLYMPALLLGVARLRSGSVRVPGRSLSWLHAVAGAFFRGEERFLPGLLPGTSAIGVGFVARREKGGG